MSKAGGAEVPTTYESLAAALGESQMKSRGKAGSGIDEKSRGAGILVDSFDAALQDHAAFQRMGTRQFLEEWARRRGK
jgi:hypothetical protein